MTFMQSGAQAYAHDTDRVLCPDETTWIVHTVPMDNLFQARQYSRDGKLVRYVESPIVLGLTGSRRFRIIDAMSVRESAEGLLFDRVEASLGIGSENNVVRRETFRIDSMPRTPPTRSD